MSKVKIEVKTEEIGKRYCGICGSELLVTILGAGHIPREIFDTETPYNEKTGKRKYAVKFQCPNWRWWKLLINHDTSYELLSDEEAKIIIKELGDRKNLERSEKK